MSTSEQIDDYIEKLADWRSQTLADVRKCFMESDPETIEEWKWMGSPVWSRSGMLAVANGHKGKVKITFAHGAKFPDPDKLFNGNDTGNTRRSIDIFENDTLDESAFKRLIQSAIEYNLANLKKNAPARAKSQKS